MRSCVRGRADRSCLRRSQFAEVPPKAYSAATKQRDKGHNQTMDTQEPVVPARIRALFRLTQCSVTLPIQTRHLDQTRTRYRCPAGTAIHAFSPRRRKRQRSDRFSSRGDPSAERLWLGAARADARRAWHRRAAPPGPSDPESAGVARGFHWRAMISSESATGLRSFGLTPLWAQ
jgi:hypothetical protein